MATQTASAVLVALKRETAFNEELTGTAPRAGAKRLRLIDSAGLVLNRNPVESEERRPDQLRYMGRLTSHTVEGSYNCEWTIGGAIDHLLESVFRATFATQSSPSGVSCTVTSNTIVRGSGSWITDGFAEGDIIYLTDATAPADNNRHLVVTSVTATVLTVAAPKPALTVQGAAGSITVNRLKKLITPVGSAALAKTSYNVEQYDRDIDQSEVFRGVRATQMQISLQPNAIAQLVFNFMGITRSVKATSDSPHFTAPTVTTGDSLVADTGVITYQGDRVLTFTGMDLTFAIDASVQPAIGTVFPGDVFLNRLNVTGSVTVMREDLAALSDFDNETEFALCSMLQEPGKTTALKDTVAIYMPRCKISGLEAPTMGGDGAKIETRTLMFGPRTAVTTPAVTGGIAYISSS